jgi:maltose phosphorylase
LHVINIIQDWSGLKKEEMKKYIKSDEWCIIEEGFDPKNHKSSESIFSIGNGHMGQRANFEEQYTGKTLKGSYVAGIYYPDKTRVGWWKNGYPEYFAKVLNSPNWIGIDVQINHEQLDIAKCRTEKFRRILNMKEGYLERSFVAIMANGDKVEVKASRFLSMANVEVGVMQYSVTPLNFTGEISFTPYIDGDVKNEDANYDEKFWNILETSAGEGEGFLLGQTKKLDFQVAFGANFWVEVNGVKHTQAATLIKGPKKSGNLIRVNVRKGDKITLYKFTSVLTSLDHPLEKLSTRTMQVVRAAAREGYNSLFASHREKWANIWAHSDIQIKGDIEAQQGIRFNIFHLNQTYTGNDERLNVGPKGFTGEKYGGSTYWDTEAYCIPFFLSTSPSRVTKNLLVYRYKHLQKAIENAQKLGFTGGAALFPMVTMNGEECHNEWEITFEEIHRNGAIAYAIYNYIRHTGDDKYLGEYGLELLIGVSRFWSQRVHFSEVKQKYVMHGVTGPNEYENNVNNNWYTNTMAKWCLDYTIESIDFLKKTNPKRFKELGKKINFNDSVEVKKWKEISSNFYFPYDEKLKIYLQQEGYLDKEQILASQLDSSIRPINQHWSWDRILRSVFIKQADVLQGIYLFEDRFDLNSIKRHFDFYEARTVHESSLSPCVHSILAARIGNIKMAYELYLRTSRLDLDDYNHEAHEGLHITSMAGTWMSIVEGFGGKRITDDTVSLFPLIPKKWDEYSFKISFRESDLQVIVDKAEVQLKVQKKPLSVIVYGKKINLKPGKTAKVPVQSKRNS